MSGLTKAQADAIFKKLRHQNDILAQTCNAINSGTATVQLSGTDVFGRIPTVDPVATFDSKQTFDNAPLLWDEELESGAGITSAWSGNTASTVITSTAATAGVFTRQTFRSMNYQPGKAVVIYMTGVIRKSIGGTGTEAIIGQGDDNNGLFFVDKEGVMNIRLRSSVTGAPVDIDIPQTEWNIDGVGALGNGLNPSGVTADWTKAQIFVITYGWLGYNDPTFGIVVDSQLVPLHKFAISNTEENVFISTPNLPLRYQLITTASSPATELEATCTSVISYGGRDELSGITRYKSTAGTEIALASEGTIYPLIGIRLKSTHIGAAIDIVSTEIQIQTGSSEIEWMLIWNPQTITGSFTYSGETNSAVETAVGNGSQTITIGTGYIIAGGFLATGTASSGSASTQDLISNALKLGADISGGVDEIVLAARPIGGSSSVDVEARIIWQELD